MSDGYTYMLLGANVKFQKLVTCCFYLALARPSIVKMLISKIFFCHVGPNNIANSLRHQNLKDFKGAPKCYSLHHSCCHYFVPYGFIEACIFYLFFWKTSFFIFLCFEFDVIFIDFITFL